VVTAPADRPGRVRLALVALAVAALTWLGAVPVTRIYHGGLPARLLLGAALGPVLVSLALRRLPAYPAAPVSVLALAGYSLLAVRLAAQSGAVPGALLPLWTDAARNGIPRLLTALIPVEPQPDTVFVPVVATWLAGLAAAEAALRYRRVLAGCAPPVLLYAAALVVVGPNARPVLWQPLLFAAVAATALAATGRPGAGAPPGLGRRGRLGLRLRLAAGGAAAMAAALALGLALGPALVHRVAGAPTDPRRYVAPPRLDARDENPLIRLSGWALNPDQPLFASDLTGTRDPVRVRLAVLSDYDGVNWLVDGDYREAGRALSAVTGPGTGDGTGRPVRQRIRIEELDGRLLPAVPAPREVDGVRVAYDQATGTLIRPDGLAAGVSYTVYSRQSTVEVNRLPEADVPAGPPVARYLELGATPPPAMSRLAEQLGADTADPYQRAQAVADFLGQHYRLVGDAPSGHAYPNLAFFLFGPRNAGGQRGTTEQFAASFAVLARMMGLPSRVVVGFQAAPGHTTVRGRDAFAWPEILFSGVGWVPFDPLPPPDTAPRPVENDFQPTVDRSALPPTQAPTIAVSGPAPGASRSPAGVAATGGGAPVGPLAAAGAGLVCALLGAVLVVGLLRRAQRTRRLARGSPAERVLGAWREVLDGLWLAGRPAAAHLTVTEVAERGVAAGRSRRPHRAGSGLPPPSLSDLAALVNGVAFARQAITEEQARRAGAQAVAYTGELRARSRWWRRLLWSLDPRPLRRAPSANTTGRAAPATAGPGTAGPATAGPATAGPGGANPGTAGPGTAGQEGRTRT
jgi:transglutaminase-like putative cysteine protease